MVIRISKNAGRALDPSPVLRRAGPRNIPEIMAMMTDFHSEDRIPWHPRKAQRAISELLANESYGIFWLIEVDGPSIGFLVLTLDLALSSTDEPPLWMSSTCARNFAVKGLVEKLCTRWRNIAPVTGSAPFTSRSSTRTLESTGSTNVKASKTGAFTFCRSGFASAHRMRSSRFRSREKGVCNKTR